MTNGSLNMVHELGWFCQERVELWNKVSFMSNCELI